MDDSVKKIHNVILEGRTKLSISGIVDMESFDEDMVVLDSQMGTMEVHGKNLHINKLSLDSGDIALDGEISSIVYVDAHKHEKPKSIMGRLFK